MDFWKRRNTMVLREVTLLAVFLRLLAAVICGGVIGLERGLKNRPAGLRTYMLVCVGACLIMVTNQYLFQVTQSGDPMRLGAQVVSGIGFLGAGTIVVTKHNQIRGLTTAAGLWAAAGVGLALGVGFYEAALVAGFLIFVILTLMQHWDNRMHRKTKVFELYIELSEELGIGALIRRIRALDLEIDDIQLEHDSALEEGTRAVIATLKSKKRVDHMVLMDKIRKLEGVIHLEEL
jgi:putative Mg2+ transporter-C (MgtC) family protein